MSYRNFRYTFHATAFSALVLLGGCSILPKAEPQQRYNLPAAASHPIGTKLDSSLFIATPNANRMINSNKVLVQPTGSEIQAYKGTLWADNAPVLVRERLSLALKESELFQAVTQDGGLQTNYALDSYLSVFQVHYQGDTPVVKLRLDAQLVDRKNSHIISQRAFSIDQPAATADIPAIIATFGVANDRLSLMVTEWLAAQIKATTTQ